jgi:itaconate CoA-transferase
MTNPGIFPGCLDGIRVVAVEQAVAAPLCTRHLADLGADVIKVERPQGDFSREYDQTVRGYASHFIWLNRGKRSVAVDIKSAAGAATIRRMLSRADVLVCNLGPGSFERQFPDKSLAELNPRLIRCHISGYGTSGPYGTRKAYDLLIQAEAGVVAATGLPGSYAKPGVSLADLAGGMYALAAINAALFARTKTGLGTRIDIALFDVLLEWMSPLLLAELHSGSAPSPAGLRHASIAPYGPYPTADHGMVFVAVQNEPQWVRFCTGVLRAPHIATAPDFESNSRRIDNRTRLESLVEHTLSQLSAAELCARLESSDVPYGRLNQVGDVLRHPQAAANDRWSPVRLPDGGTATVVTSPFLRNREESPGRKAPSVGEHTEELLAEIGPLGLEPAADS